MKKPSWISHGCAVFYTLSFVFCSLSILNARFGTRVSELEIQAMEHGAPTSIAPEVLERAPESFRLGLRVESQDFPVEEMARTKAWAKLQGTAAAYARRLELIQRHNRKQSLWIACLCPISMIGVLVFVMLGRGDVRDEVEGEVQVRKKGTDAVRDAQ